MLAKIKLTNSPVSILLGVATFVAIYAYYFWLAYTIPPFWDDFRVEVLKGQSLSELYKYIIGWFKWNARIGETFLTLVGYFGIPYYLIMPPLHILNLFLGYYLIKNQSLNIFKLSHIKEFWLLFIIYTFLNSAPFQGIVWQAGNLSCNFGFIFLMLFFIYIKKLVLQQNISRASHVWGLLFAYITGWTLETVPAHVLASFVFLCFYLRLNDIKIVSYLWAKKPILLAYSLTAVAWLTHAIVANFWRRRFVGIGSVWQFYEDMTPIPVITRILALIAIILAVYYFMNDKRLSDKTKQNIALIFVLALLNWLTCFINIKSAYGRAFTYHSFIAGGVVFYAYLNFIATKKNLLLDKIVMIYAFYIAISAAYLLGYNVLLERFRFQYHTAILEQNRDNRVVYLPNAKTIPVSLFFNESALKLVKLAKLNTYLLNKLNQQLFEWNANPVTNSKAYRETHYPNIKKANFIDYEKFVARNNNMIERKP